MISRVPAALSVGIFLGWVGASAAFSAILHGRTVLNRLCDGAAGCGWCASHIQAPKPSGFVHRKLTQNAVLKLGWFPPGNHTRSISEVNVWERDAPLEQMSMVRLRLTRMGRKKRPFYRIVATDSRSPRDGRIIEALGYYDPMKTPAEVKVDLERVDYWMGVGASPSDTVSHLIKRARGAGEAAEADPS